MDAQQPRQWGVTNPISNAPPTEADLKLNDDLVKALKAQDNFESPEGIENRQKVLRHYQRVTEAFVKRACKAKKCPESTVESAGGKVFPYGSYALGVSNPGSDIDTLLVAPKHVNSHDFFAFFEQTFREMSDAKDIGFIVPAPDAYVPIIKMEFRGIDIDLIFVSLPSISSIGPDFTGVDKNMLRGLDDVAMRSVNGIRMVKELLDSVPEPKAFRYAVRAVKLWSTQRAIYGNVFGYPGGVAWAIMVARICQLYPKACGATVLSKFFSLMKQWHWPRPVMLKHIEEGSMGLRVWNPSIYHGDKFHLMPVITPAFPSMCATHTITHSTKHVMLEEFNRADSIVSAISLGKKSWVDLFERHTFFTKDHKYYLSIIAACRDRKSYEGFNGLVQSKVRLLCKGIDDGDAGAEIARPYNKYFERVHRCKNEDQVEAVTKGHLTYLLSPEDTLALQKSPESAGDDHIIHTATWYIGLTLPEGPGSKSLDISFPVADFKRLITGTDSYDENTMSVNVIYTRHYDIPPDCFQPGETRPTKSTKDKKKKTVKAPKRTGTEAGLDVRK
ncbi:Poly(A) polymeras-like protein [Lophiotrema nucula]|uniref:Poly(A) polymerase n=1 Tax=Lophiotrema nucula TaxID=690887 RepID=A0A6A5ZLK7_9PLEO|nr:Poly(A) polymeras-like protein [Lophiotrema nucula]